MAKLKGTIVSVALVGACALGAWKVGTCVLGEGEATSAEHLANHVWLERLPTDERDIITHFLALDSRDGRFGIVGRSSAWRHVIEVFKWFREGDRLTLDFPQERVRSEFAVRTWECAGEAPAPFELCLELTRGHRSVHFFSRHDWVVEPQGDLAADEAALAELIAETPALRPLSGALAPLDPAQLAATPASDEAVDDGAAWGILARED